MSFAVHLRIGRLGADGMVFLPLDREDVRRVLDELADREPDGSLPSYRGSVVGYLAGLPLSFHSLGLLDLVVPHFAHAADRQCLYARLSELVDRLGCVIYHADSWEDWTEYVRQESGQSL